ncbi:four helix bundle protein [Candidatus Falkowbacteria bacterium]|nr:four helix bundle protein [Candidatus Falkowbacteria bacterium]
MDNSYSKTFRQLVVWQEAKKLCLNIYRITKNFPQEEVYALVSQLRRSAYSVLANIAEGNERKGIKDRLNFFNIARGSLVELDCLLELSFDLNYLNEKDYKNLLEKINKVAYLLNKFIVAQKS